MKKKIYLLIASLSISFFGTSQIVINEIQPSTSTVELKNLGNDAVDVSSWILCAVGNYSTISSLTATAGDPSNLLPGEILVLTGRTTTAAGDELSLYIDNQYTNSTSIVDYLHWGTHTGGRSGVAETAGLWTATTVADAITTGMSLQYDGDGQTSTDGYSLAAPTIGTETVCTQGVPSGAYVGLTDQDGAGMDNDTLTFATGSDNVPVQVENNSIATLSYWYVITDNNDNILTWLNPASFTDVTQEIANRISGAPAGECHVWGWSYKGLSNPVVGDPITSLNDNVCEEISTNFIVVIRQDPHGAYLGLTDQDGAGMDTDTLTFATGSDNVPVQVENNSSANYLSYWYVITDNNDNILTWINPASFTDVAQEIANRISGAPAGECHVWGWSYKGLSDPVVGDPITSLDDDVEESISANYVVVIRQDPDGGTVGTYVQGNDWSSDLTINAGTDQGIFYVKNTSTSDYLSYWYIITDENDNILDWVNNMGADSSQIDISGAPVGECHIWGWSYKGLSDPVMGDPISSLDDDTEESISSNWITVTRSTPTGIFDLGSASKELSAYPSPTTGPLNIDGENIESTQVISLSGNVKFTGGSSSIIDISELNAGIYILQVLHTDGTISTSKILKK